MSEMNILTIPIRMDCIVSISMPIDVVGNEVEHIYRVLRAMPMDRADGPLEEKLPTNEADAAEWSILQKEAYLISHAGTPPYGYMRGDGHMVVCPEEQAVVRMIFDMWRNRFTQKRIARELDADSISPRRANRWSVFVVKDILNHQVNAWRKKGQRSDVPKMH